MRNIRILVSAVVIALLTSACHTELNERISSLKVSVTELENTIITINSNITALQEVASSLESNDNIIDIQEIVRNGVKGYRLTFTSGAIMDLMQGVDGVTPIVGIKRGDDGEYYWTIQKGENGAVQWMTSSLGIKCRATSTNIKLKNEDGWWWWSLDETNWTAFCESVGESGKTVFQSIDTSNPYYVTFTLANGQSFKLMRDGAVTKMKQFCDEATNEFNVYKKLVTELDTTLFVKSVTEIVDDNNAIIGYKFNMAGNGVDGKSISITSGSDITPALISIKIQTDSLTGDKFWMYKLEGDEDYSYMTVDSTKLRANPVDGYPQIGLVDSLDVYYLTITSGFDGKVDFLRNDNGDLVQLNYCNGFEWFKDAIVSADSIKLTLMDSTAIVLPRYNPSMQSVPDMTLSVTADTVVFDAASQVYQYIEPSKTYTIEAVIDNNSDKVSVNAMVMDGSGYVKEITCVENTYSISFKTSSEISPFVSVAVFLNWDDKSVMKVMKFERAAEE